MKIGISSWALPWAIGVKGYPMPDARMDVAGLVEIAAKLGVDVVQIADNITYDSAQLKEAVQIAKENNIEIELGIQGTDTYILRSVLALAMLYGIKTIRTLPHKGDDVPEVDELIERLNSVKNEFEKAEVKLCIENHDFYKSTELAQVMNQVNSKYIGICFDAANNFGQAEGVMECFANLKPYINNFHIKDFKIERIDNKMGFTITGTAAGQGMLDLKALKKEMPECSWIIEQWTPWQEDITITKQLEYDWLITGIKNLKNIRGH